MRVAVLFDNTRRPETTGFYVRRALGKVADAEHFLPAEFDALARGHHGRFDLFLAVDDGLDYRLPRSLRPLAFWAIDTHVSFAQVLMKAEECDYVFAAQKDGGERLRRGGIESASWLPLACDPAIHRPHSLPKQYDVAFVGNVLPGPRAELVRLIERRFPNAFIGQRYLHEMAKAYSAARIVFNRGVADDLNMRVFEALACGALLVTNALPNSGQDELFQDGQHFVTYRDAEELVTKAARYLEDEESRERIAAAGRRRVLEAHTYRHRIETILRAVAAERPVRFSVAAASSPERGYYEFSRPEVLALIPESVRRVLDIGCGAGRLGAGIKARQTAAVVGIEMDAEAARAAAARLDEVRCADIEDPSVEFPEAHFDCVVCADVLEHLRRPERLLGRIRQWLSPEGALVASIPNVQHHSAVTSLLAGNFTYETAGLLDETHLRFFTRREIEKLLFRAGFAVECLQSVPGPGDESWWREGSSADVQAGGLRISGIERSRAREFYTYQYLVRARTVPPKRDGLTSIVIVTHNEREYTRLCLDSLRRFTDEPYELIVVDNGSTDGTPEFLRSFPDVRVIENTDNRGFPAAVNQALAVARGAQVLLLNNDTVVTTAWLRRMLEALHSDDRIGVVGPVSNNVSGSQQISVSYSQLADLDGFAWDWGQAHRGETHESDRLVGFCLLVKRQLIERIGFLDERFGIGNFEDDDYCRRAIRAGFRCVVARDAFVHHFGGRTFLGSGLDYERLLAENERKYAEKWKTEPPLSGGSAPLPKPDLVAARASDRVKQPDAAPRLSLCMIVRDNERTIAPCLGSIRPWVDEMVVVDTGSKDLTPEICRELGAKVFEFPWCDDFSAARNESLKYAKGEWIFWMDSDDTILDECGRKLRALADGPHAEAILGYVMQVHCPSPNSDGTQDVTVVDHIKLFRNRPDLRFEHRIHEQILPAIRRAGGEVAFTDVFVVHSGSDHTPEGRRRKLERDFRLLALDAAERPDHPFVLFNLGMTYADAERQGEAIDALRRCLAVSRADESHVRKCYALLVAALSKTGRHEDAWTTCTEALDLYPDDKELRFREALLHQQSGRLNEAEASYRRVLSQASDRHFSSADRGISGYKARHNLALVLEDQGRWRDAEAQWRAVLAELPEYKPAWRGLGELLLRDGKWTDALEVASHMKIRPLLRADGCILQAKAEEARENAGGARRILEDGLAEFPGNDALLRELCRLLFERFDLREAEPYLKRLLAQDPGDAGTLHNLGVLHLSANRPGKAAVLFLQSLRIRAVSPRTAMHLGQALWAYGKQDEALRAWREGLRLSPESVELRQALAQNEAKLKEGTGAMTTAIQRSEDLHHRATNRA